MKNSITRLALATIFLLLVSTLSFAADVKASDKKTAAKPGAEKPATDTKAPAKKELVDINSASDAELKAVPGIGDAYTAKIVVGRPYANKAQLKSRNILPGPVYEKVKDLIIAKQPPKDVGKDSAAKPADKGAPAKKK